MLEVFSSSTMEDGGHPFNCWLLVQLFLENVYLGVFARVLFSLL